MSPNVVLPIDGGFLRPLIEADVHQGYVDGLNDPQVNRYLDSVKASVQTAESVRGFGTAGRFAFSFFLVGVWEAGPAWHRGTVRLHSIEHRHGTAHIGACIFDRSCWGLGVGSASVRAATDWALSSLGLRWIEAGVFEANIASQRVFLSAGYAWMFDIREKYLLEDQPATVKVYARRASLV